MVLFLVDHANLARASDVLHAHCLQRNARLMQLESSRPVGVRTLAHFARRNFADKLRRQGAGQAVAALLGGWDEVRLLRTVLRC